MRYHLTPLRMAISKKSTQNVEGTGEKEALPPLLGWESKLLTGITKVTWKTRYRNTIGPGRSHSLAYI